MPNVILPHDVHVTKNAEGNETERQCIISVVLWPRPSTPSDCPRQTVPSNFPVPEVV